MIKTKFVLNIIRNMGALYIGFRVFYAFKSKSGLLRKQIPKDPSFKKFITKQAWINLQIPFFQFSNTQNDFYLEAEDKELLKYKVENIFNNIFIFFSSTEFNLGKDFDWVTNPDTAYKYDISKHWSEIEDLSKDAGDIKYVWEKARFTFIYDVIRYDYHFKKNSSVFVFHEIEDFIDKNPINQGPNYKCSQEISLRILNWTYALFYYKDSDKLTNKLFEKIINSIYWQLQHIYSNINFSRIAVRNNHAITETSILYLSGLLFPFIPESKKWSVKGNKWLLKEIDYQIYSDGSYLQFSHNYHRVVIQTLTYVLRIKQLNSISIDESLHKKLISTLSFLYNHQDKITGKLPNYGSNDGALFFPLSSNNYRDFRPQLQAFGLLLGIKLYNQNFEDIFWFNLINEGTLLKPDSKISFIKGGFYGFRDKSLTTIRCGIYNDRPSQADGLHLDIWHDGVNYLFDPGTYRYNTEDKYIKFYNGTSGHNTLAIGEHDQMLKGGRFIWYYWTKYVRSEIEEYDDKFVFKGEIKGFSLLGKNIIHERTVIKYKNRAIWEIIDRTNYNGKLPIKLYWNVNPKFINRVKIVNKDNKGNILRLEKRKGWFSELYGMKEEFTQQFCVFDGSFCKTIIEIKA